MKEVDNLVTIYDIAQRAGCSPATVSKALNNQSDIAEKTKENIRQIAKEMDYTPNYNAKALITKKSWMIGVLYSEDQGMGLEHPLFGGVVEGFKRRIEEEGYEIIFIAHKLGVHPMSYLEHCRRRGVDAVFLTVVNKDDPEIIEIIKSDIICVSSDYVTTGLTSVISDNVQGTRLAMDYLFNLGHRRIGYIGGPLEHIASFERHNIYKTSLAEKGIEYQPGLVSTGVTYDNRSGYTCMKEILKSSAETPTAVFAACDSMAFGAILAAREEGYRVPEDISFIGFDDHESSVCFNPPLTTIRQFRRKMGEASAEVLLSMIKDGIKENRDQRIPVELIIRDSCIPVNNP
jgi:DNA-binding LacI/PurR family transcriptional regulator